MKKQYKVRKTYSQEFKIYAMKRHSEDGVSYIKVNYFILKFR
ncbi:TPA: hypothetical protein ACOTG0_003046 [Clostridium perfringens]